MVNKAISMACCSVIKPTPSICPETEVPSQSTSHLQGPLQVHLISLDQFSQGCLFRLSSITWTVKVWAVKFITVKHAPFTAMLSPKRASSRTVCARMTSFADLGPLMISFTVPISSIKPVNMSVHLSLRISGNHYHVRIFHLHFPKLPSLRQ